MSTSSPSRTLLSIALAVILLVVSVVAPQSVSAQDEPAAEPAPAETTPPAQPDPEPAPQPTTPPETGPSETGPPATEPPAEAPPAAEPPIVAGEGTPGVDPSAGDGPEGDADGESEDPDEGAGEAPSGETPAEPTPSAAPRFSAAELIELQKQYDEAVGDEAEALAIWELARQRLEEIDARSDRITGMLAWIELEIKVAEADHDDAISARERTEDELEKVQAELADEELRLKRQAVEAYMGGSSSNENILTTVLNSGSIDEVESVREYAHVALDDQENTITSIEDLEVRVDELLVSKNASEDRAQTALTRVESFEEEALERNAEVEELRVLADEEEAELRRQYAVIQTTRVEFEQRLNAIEQDSDSASAALQRSQANQTPGPPPRMHSPLLVAAISSGFGPRLHPIWGNVRMHNGLDYGGNSGDEIYAAAAGVVVMAELRGGYGNTVVIDHGDQWGTLYAHQSDIRVVPGQQVARGEVIGWVGSTGHSTGPHLHFELRQFGAPRDPLNHIDQTEEHPVTCEVLIRTGHPNDLNEAQSRDECAEYFEQD